jgi:hypothetical protein
MRNKFSAAAKLLLSGALAFGAIAATEGSLTDSSAIAAPGGGGGGPGGPGGGPGGGGPGGGGGNGGNNGNDKGVGNGAAVSAAGSVNAAKASPNARAHAATNSVVGKIATFETERLAQIAARDLAQTNLTNLQTELAELTAARDVLANPLSDPTQTIAAQQILAGYGVTYGTQLDSRIADLPGVIAQAMIDVADAQSLLNDMAAQIASLQPAANKEVTASVVEAVKGWLGLSE